MRDPTRPARPLRTTALALVLGGMLLLGALPAGEAATVRTPGVWTAINAVWALGPEGTGGLALRAETNAAAAFVTASLTLRAGVKLQDFAAFSYDIYYATAGGCGGGSPRIQLAVDTDGDLVSDGNVFVYGGAHPFPPGCQPTGQWVHDDVFSGLRYDSTQLGGPFYGTRAQAAAAAGPGHQVLRATFVWDSTWLFGPSVFWLDNVRVDTYLLDEPPAHACVHAQPPSACSIVEVHI